MNGTVKYTKFRFFNIVALAIVIISTSFVMISPAPLIGEIVKSMGVVPGVATTITMFTFNMVMAVFALIGGFVADKTGVERTWVGGLIIIIIGSLLTPFIGSTPAGLVVVRCLHAIGTGPIMGSILKCVTQRLKPNERPYAFGFLGCSVIAGITLGLLITPRVFVATGNWQTAIALTSIESGIALVFAIICLFGPKPPVAENIGLDSGSTKQLPAIPLKLILSGTIIVLAIMGFIDSWTQQAYNDLAPGYYAQNAPLGLGLGPVGAGNLLSWGTYAAMLGMLVSPVINQKIFKGKPQGTICVGLIVAAAFVFIFRYLGPDNKLLLALVPCGIMFFSSFVNPAISGYISTHYPDGVVGKIGGFLQAVSVFGAAIGVALSAFLLTTTGLYRASMITLMLVALAGGIAVLFLKPPKNIDALKKELEKYSDHV